MTEYRALVGMNIEPKHGEAYRVEPDDILQDGFDSARSIAHLVSIDAIEEVVWVEEPEIEEIEGTAQVDSPATGEAEAPSSPSAPATEPTATAGDASGDEEEVTGNADPR